MKNLIITILISLCFSVISHAQHNGYGSFKTYSSIGAFGGIGIPLGNFGADKTIGYGGYVDMSFGLTPISSITLSFGSSAWLIHKTYNFSFGNYTVDGKENINLVLVGSKIFMNYDPKLKYYGLFEIGGTTGTGFCIAGGGGVEYFISDKFSVDLNARLLWGIEAYDGEFDGASHPLFITLMAGIKYDIELRKSVL